MIKKVMALVIVGCCICSGSTFPSPPKSRPVLRSPKSKGDLENAPMRRAAIPPPPVAEQVMLNWKYPLTIPRAGLVFDVEHRDDLKAASWAKVGEVSAPPFYYSTAQKRSGFFRVIARSLNQVSLIWDRPNDPSVVSYRVYFGPAHLSYTNSVFVPGVTVTRTIVTNISSRTFFVATSLSGLSMESLYSNEVDYTPETIYQVSGLSVKVQ